MRWMVAIVIVMGVALGCGGPNGVSSQVPRVSPAPVAHFEDFARISDGGASVSASLDIIRDSETSLILRLHGDCTNSLALVGVSATVVATLIRQDGTVFSEIRVDVPEAPPRGIAPPTSAGHNAEIRLSTRDGGAETIKEIRFKSFDRAASSPISVENVKAAAKLVLPLILGT